MDVRIGNNRVRLDKNDVIGTGGEGTVYKKKVSGSNIAIKVYHAPDNQRAKKLESFVNNQWNFPANKLAMPTGLVYDSKGKVIGFTMPYLGIGFEEVTSLSNKKYRTQFGVTTKDVVNIFLDGARSIDTIHNQKVVIGDFNDMNALFRGREMLFVDVDAWQFLGFPCVVGNEAFVDPALYGIDLTTGSYFKPEHDWYSYAVMLFKSLLLAHPFGGVHKKYRSITDRAARRITVFDESVTYPKIALTPDILSDELAHVFHQFFKEGKRGVFPINTLENYQNSLVECGSCKSYYPNTLPECPVCSAKTLFIITRPSVVSKDVEVTEFIRTNGPIVFHKVIGSSVYLIAYESGKAVLHVVSQGKVPRLLELFAEIPGASYDLFGSTLIVNLPHSEELMLVDISGAKPKAIARTETDVFAINRRAVFKASGANLFRITGQVLLKGEILNTEIVERQVRTVVGNQTWFTVDPGSCDENPTIFGVFQVINRQMCWIAKDGSVYEVHLRDLPDNESLIDISVRFSASSVLVRRVTEQGGVRYLRTEMIGMNGEILRESPRVKFEDHPFPSVHGQAYAGGYALVATDDGIVQEEIMTGSFKTFEGTKGLVIDQDSLYKFGDGILAVSDNSVNLIRIKGGK